MEAGKKFYLVKWPYERNKTGSKQIIAQRKTEKKNETWNINDAVPLEFVELTDANHKSVWFHFPGYDGNNEILTSEIKHTTHWPESLMQGRYVKINIRLHEDKQHPDLNPDHRYDWFRPSEPVVHKKIFISNKNTLDCNSMKISSGKQFKHSFK